MAHNFSGPSRFFAGVPRGVVPVLMMAALVALATRVEADEAGITTLADSSVEAFLDRERLLAEKKFLSEEITRLRRAGSDGLDLASVTPEAREILTSMLDAEATTTADRLQQAADESETSQQELATRWKAVRADLLGRQSRLFELQMQTRFAGQFISVLKRENRWFWFCSLWVVVAILGQALRDRRHEIRKMLRGGRGRAMGMTLVLTLVLMSLVGITATTFLFGDSLYEALITATTYGDPPPRQRIKLKQKATEAEIERSKEQLETIRAGLDAPLKAWRTRTQDHLSEDSLLLKRWVDSREAIRRLAVNLVLEDRIASEMRQDFEEIATTQETFQIAAGESESYFQTRRWTRGAFGLLLIGLSATGNYFFWRGFKRRRTAEMNTCPRCLATDTLQETGTPLAANEADEADDEAEADEMPEALPVRCGNMLPESPPSPCRYELRQSQRPMKKLSFSAMGVPASGKTHALAMVYRELSVGNFQKMIHFDSDNSTQRDDWDATVDDILRRYGTTATHEGRIPDPLAFCFRDRDRWFGRSDVLTQVLDFSGEITTGTKAEDHRRRRALAGDGLLLFLDPTLPGDTQKRALERLCEDLRSLHSVKPESRLRMPIALCISKIDLLPNQGFSEGRGAAAVQEFYERLGKIDPEGEAMSQRVIAERSRLCSTLRRTLWPGWDVDRQVRSLFGGRYRFFPLSPIGLDSIGETDPEEQVIAPFGILEPLLWLLHMNGYPVLD